MNGVSRMNSSISMSHHLKSVHEHTKTIQAKSSEETSKHHEKNMPVNCNMKDMHQNVTSVKAVNETLGNKFDARA